MIIWPFITAVISFITQAPECKPLNWKNVSKRTAPHRTVSTRHVASEWFSLIQCYPVQWLGTYQNTIISNWKKIIKLKVVYFVFTNDFYLFIIFSYYLSFFVCLFSLSLFSLTKHQLLQGGNENYLVLELMSEFLITKLIALAHDLLRRLFLRPATIIYSPFETTWVVTGCTIMTNSGMQ